MTLGIAVIADLTVEPSTKEAIFHGLTVLLIATLTSALVIPKLIRTAQQFGLIDTPDNRRIHNQPMPRCGGIAIFLGMHAACLYSILAVTTGIASTGLTLSSWLILIASSIIALAVGLIDDHSGLKAPLKLTGHITTGIVVFILGVRITEVFGHSVPFLLSLALTIVWIVLLINAFNLIDGIDGLAAGLTIIASLGILGATVHRNLTSDALIVTALIGACAGFIFWNKHPAKLFMGDCGSNLCGLVLAITTLHAGEKSTTLGYLWMPILAICIPLIDTILAIWRRGIRIVTSRINRSSKPSGIMTGDLEHLHHRLLKKGICTGDVAASLILINALVVLVGLIGLPTQNSSNLMYLPFAAGLALLCTHIIPFREYRETARLINYILRARRQRFLSILLLALIDFLGLAAGLACACILVHPNFPISRSLDEFQRHLIVWCGMAMTCLIVVEILPQLWSKRRLVAMAVLIAALSIFTAFAYDIRYEFAMRNNFAVLVELLLFVVISLAFVGSIRWATICSQIILSAQQGSPTLRDFRSRLKWYVPYSGPRE